MKTYFLTAVLSVLPFCGSEAQAFDNTPIKLNSIELLLGKWYEIARFDHSFERGQDNVTAFYSQDGKGNILVSNVGWKNGKIKSANGYAKRTDMSGLLRVSFFRPFYSDYRILMMGHDYSYALIGGSSDDYLWILSRTPTMIQADRNATLREASRRGYTTNDLIWIDQSRNIDYLSQK
ncbi:MAG: lipocalin family protein [Prevotellaceae bacterium]|nr:lipocalin family protein [Prevotellaceae bacterium]